MTIDRYNNLATEVEYGCQIDAALADMAKARYAKRSNAITVVSDKQYNNAIVPNDYTPIDYVREA